MSENQYSQEEQYSSDVSDQSTSTPINNLLNSLQDAGKEKSSSGSLAKPSSSKVEKVSVLFNLYYII